eukprot:2091295-Prymnesium_polylepis.1
MQIGRTRHGAIAVEHRALRPPQRKIRVLIFEPLREQLPPRSHAQWGRVLFGLGAFQISVGCTGFSHG